MELLSSSQIENLCKNRAAFTAYSYSQSCFSKNHFTQIIFEDVQLNTRNFYGIEDDQFIAPCDGVFSFTAGARLSGIKKGYAGIGLFVNNALYTMVDYKLLHLGLVLLQGTVSIYLTKGNRVDLRAISTAHGAKHLYAHTIGVFIWFSGNMLFQN